jgi:Prokaryotic E2 family E/Multiubiquitin
MSDDPLDLEELSKSGQRPPTNARHFRIRVDMQTYVVDVPSMTGRAILTLAGKIPPDRFILHLRVRGERPREINLDELVDLTQPGVERFTTLPRDQTDGVVRRQFVLSEDDTVAMDELGLSWETVTEGQSKWVLVHQCPVPPGYVQREVSIAVRVENGYPRTPLDMAYYDPPLSLASKKAIPASDQVQQIDGRPWQRWSRHYSPENPWRPGIDSIATHVTLARAWLERELTR